MRDCRRRHYRTLCVRLRVFDGGAAVGPSLSRADATPAAAAAAETG